MESNRCIRGEAKVRSINVCDYMPIVSTFTSSVDIYQMYTKLPAMKASEIQGNHYFRHLNQKSSIRVALLLIPVVGNIIIGLNDIMVELLDIIVGQKYEIKKFGFEKLKIRENDINISVNKTELTNKKEGGEEDWTKDNALLITKSASETNEWKLELIKNAESSIEISGSISGGKVFRDALRAVEDRIKERKDLKVHILTTSDLLEEEDKQLIEEMNKKYPRNFYCLITNRHMNRNLYPVTNHVKVVIVDEKYYVIGGTNYQDNLTQEAKKDAKSEKLSNLDNFLGSGSRDMDVVGRSSSTAKVARDYFFKLFAILEAKEKKSPADSRHSDNGQLIPCAIEKFDENEDLTKDVVVKVTAGSGDTEENACVNEFSRLIESCSKTITIAQMYFMPQSKMFEALNKKKLDETVSITVITTGITTETPLASYFYAYGNRLYRYFLAQNFKGDSSFYEYNNGNNIYHKKVLVVDHLDKPTDVAIGSFNWGGKSHQDYEMILTIQNEEIGQKVKGILDEDITKSNKIVRPDFLPFTHKALGIVQSLLFPRYG